ncbi:hypothetical protein BpHYR1_036882, partial [Brachionus plicatilis]
IKVINRFKPQTQNGNKIINKLRLLYFFHLLIIESLLLLQEPVFNGDILRAFEKNFVLSDAKNKKSLMIFSHYTKSNICQKSRIVDGSGSTKLVIFAKTKRYENNEKYTAKNY